jgi:predicted short-subunit dehydrogenase-like oxidoreductase (DUF2520 family)
MSAAVRPERDAYADITPAAPAAYPLVVGIVGTGRVGGVLGAALHAAGHRVIAASGASAASRDRIARLLPYAAHLPVPDVARAATGLLLIAVPDDALAEVVAELHRAGALRPGQVVAHPSGVHGLAVLGPVARPLALHPAMTFTGGAGDLSRLPGTAFGITAPEALRPFAARLVTDLGGVPEWVAEADRPLYHAALAHGANHLVTLVNEAADLLRAAGVAQPSVVLGPLLRAGLDNALRFGDAALTGPVSRGDAGTVAKHLDRMPVQFAPAYLALARRTADRAAAAGRLSPTGAELLLDAFAEAQLLLDAPALAARRRDPGRPVAADREGTPA